MRGNMIQGLEAGFQRYKLLCWKSRHPSRISINSTVAWEYMFYRRAGNGYTTMNTPILVRIPHSGWPLNETWTDTEGN